MIQPAKKISTTGRSVLLALAACGMVASAAAQNQPRPPAWAQGRPPEIKKSPLAPHPPKLTVTAPNEIPLDRLEAPPGFKVELWAHGMPGARMMARGDRGTVWVGTRAIGRVYEVKDRGGERETRILADKLTQPNGVAFTNGALYVAAINKVLRYEGIENNPNVKPVDLTDKFNLPPEGHHGWKFLAFGPDKRLYIPVGGPCNVCEVDRDKHALIQRHNPDGSGREIVARGVRNSVGFDFHPRTGELWFTDNGRDWMGDDGPQDELNRVTKTGANFGFPYCHAQGILDRDLRKADACRGVVRPVALLGPHAAALGMRFYTGDMFPAAYKDTIFVARRGSWNRSNMTGYDVINGRPSKDGKRAKITPFLTGFMDPKANEFWGRPVDVLQLPDGSLLVADEQLGAIYRVSYAGGGTMKN